MVDKGGSTSETSVVDVLTRALAFARAMMLAAAAPTDLVRSLLSKDLRRGFPKYYRSRRRIGVANIAAATVLARNRSTRFASALTVGVAAVWLKWRSRSSWGTAAGLPPGRVFTGSRAVHDPDHLSTAANRYGSVFKTNHFEEPAVCLMGMHDATEVFREHADSLGVVPLAFNKYVPGGLVRWKSGREHDEYRRIFQHLFGQHLIRSNQYVLESSIDRMLRAMHSQGSSAGIRPNLYMPDMVFEAWAQLFFGIAPDDRRYGEVSQLFETIDVSRLNKPDRMVDALLRLENLLEAEGITNDDCALAALRAHTGDRHLEAAMIRNLIFTLDMTRTDICGLLIWALYHAATNRHVLDELAAEVQRDENVFTTRSLANRMVSESLRLEQSEHLFRRAERDIDIDRFRVPAGWLVRVCTQESHRDPAVFPHPGRYDPDRFLDPSWNAAAYAPFGIDGHSCIGEALTRRFTSTLLIRLARRYDVEVTNDGPRQMGEFQHWTPSDDFRIRLVSRQDLTIVKAI